MFKKGNDPKAFSKPVAEKFQAFGSKDIHPNHKASLKKMAKRDKKKPSFSDNNFS